VRFCQGLPTQEANDQLIPLILQHAIQVCLYSDTTKYSRKNFEKQHVDKDGMKIMLECGSEAAEENCDEVDEEADITEQTPVPTHQGVDS
jgi:hypothetical protein